MESHLPFFSKKFDRLCLMQVFVVLIFYHITARFHQLQYHAENQKLNIIFIKCKRF
jgi:hypothetical protein